jgi:hypothetical protein
MKFAYFIYFVKEVCYNMNKICVQTEQGLYTEQVYNIEKLL